MHKYLLLTLALFVVTIFFATFKLTESPSVWYDEGGYFQISRNISEGYGNGLRVSPVLVEPVSKVITVGYPLLYPLASILHVFGDTIFVARLFMAFCILLLVLLSYLLARKLFSLPIAISALALLSTFPPLYGNGKTVLGEVPGLVYLTLFLLFLERAVQGKSKHFSLIIAGVGAGLCIATKPIFLLLVPVLVLVSLVAKIRKEFTWKDLGILSLSTLAPVLVWMFVQFQGDTLADILNFYTNPQQVQSLFSTVISNIKLVFSDVGLLYLVASFGIWAVSVGIRFYERKRISISELSGFVFSSLIILAFLRTAGYYRYLFPAQIVSLLYLPHSLSVMWTYFQEKLKITFPFQKMFVVLLVVILSLLGIFQLSFHSWVADFYGSHKTEYWINYFQEHTIENTLFYDVPEVALFAHGTEYYQYLNLSPAARITVGDENLSLLKQNAFDQVFIETSTLETLDFDLKKTYHSLSTPYKYTILQKIHTRQ